MADSSSKLTLTVDCVRPGLDFSIWLDQAQIWHGDPCGAGMILVSLPQSDGDHVLEMKLSGKGPEHTKVDAQGQILEDVMVTVSDIKIDEVNIDQILSNQAVYEHDFNGTGQTTRDRFYGHMGCNGHVRLQFFTPVYIWLLENM